MPLSPPTPAPVYPAPGAILSCLWEGLRLPFERGLEIERQYFGRLAAGDVARALIGLRFFARQRAAKAGLGRPDPADPLAQTCRAAILAEAERLRAEGVPVNRINNAALAAGITPAPLPAQPVGGSAVSDGEMLQPLAHRLLMAGAAAVAGAEPEDPDNADIVAVQAGGFPAWTSGPLAMLGRAAPAMLAAEINSPGLESNPSKPNWAGALGDSG